MAIVNQGVGVRPGSAARSTSSTRRSEFGNVGKFRADHLVLPPPHYYRWNLLIPFRAPNLLESKCYLPEFSGSATMTYGQPLL